MKLRQIWQNRAARKSELCKASMARMEMNCIVKKNNLIFFKFSHVILKAWPKMYYGWLFLQKKMNDIFLQHLRECFSTSKGHK